MSASPIRRRAPRIAVLAVASLLVLGGCTQGQRAPGNYAGAEDNFLEGCVDTAKSDSAKVDDSGQPADATAIESPQKYCQCLFDAISDPKTGIEYSEFKKIQSDLQDTPQDDPPTLPKKYLDVIADSKCDASSSSGTSS